VESQNYLGIYISKNTATAVSVDPKSKGEKVLGYFSVSVQDEEQPAIQNIISQIAQHCEQKNITFSNVAVALDCALFMQHNVHSDFTDTKQIASTIRFDTEEALTTDISDVALAFEINSIGENGSDLTVFTAQRKVLSEVLLSLQQHNLDPITIEPDVNCLLRLIQRKNSSDESGQETIFGILSDHSGYLIAPQNATDDNSQGNSTVRTFLVGPRQNRTELLTREILVTTALSQSGEAKKTLKVFDSAGTINVEKLGERSNLIIENVNWLEKTENEIQASAHNTNTVDFSIAYGTALTLFEKEHNVNFRDDFNPFQGKILKKQKALKFTAVSFVILFVAIGLYFHTQLFSTNRNTKKLHNRIAQEYAAVTFDTLPNNFNMNTAIRKLSTLKTSIEKQRQGIIPGDDTSISSKLTHLLSAFNKCAAQTNLNLEKITINEKNIVVTGDTSSRTNTIKLFDVIRKEGFSISNDRYDTSGGRDVFTMSLAVESEQ
jgi:hypothetical protein